MSFTGHLGRADGETVRGHAREHVHGGDGGTRAAGKQECPRTPCSALGARHSRWALSTSTLLEMVLFAGIFLLNFFQGTDVDMWWHLATGRYIVESGTIPTTDPFSYTAIGQPWVAHEWLAELLMYLIYRFGGYLVLAVSFASVITLTFWISFRLLRTLELRVAAASCITFWVAMMSMAGWHIRPQAFSYLFCSLYLYLLMRSRRRLDGWLWLLPAVMVVWVNLHAGYVMGLMLPALFFLGEGINWLASGQRRGEGLWHLQGSGTSRGEKGNAGTAERGELGARDAAAQRTEHDPSRLRRYLAVGAATVAATSVNPNGLSMLLYPFTYVGTQNASMKYITEWQSPDFHYYFFFVFGASMMVLMVAPIRRPVDWALAVPLLALTAMSLQSVRVIPFYAVVAAPFLGLRLASPSTVIQNPVPTAHHLSPRARHATPWNWLLLALCVAAFASTLFLSDRAQIGPEPSTKDYPAAGVQYIKDRGLRGNLFNTYHWGGFLIWSFYPERRVFIDGRPDMYGDAFVEEYRKLHDARFGWEQVIEAHQIEIALVEKESRTATLLAASKEWEEVFRGDVESVFVKSTSRSSGATTGFEVESR